MKAPNTPHAKQAQSFARLATIIKGFRYRKGEPGEKTLKAYKEKHGEAMADSTRRYIGVKSFVRQIVKWNKKKRTHGFSVPFRLETEPTDSRGLKVLRERSKEDGGFPEVYLRERYNESRDRIEIEVALHRRTRQGVESLRVGILPALVSKLMQPLLKNDMAPKAFVFSVRETGGASFHTGLAVDVALKRPDKQARQWVDEFEARKVKAQVPSRQGGGVPAYIKRSGGSAGYAGRDYGQKAQQLKREIGELQKKANELEARRVNASHIGREIAKKRGQLENLRMKAVRSGHDRTDAPTVEDWLRENIALRGSREVTMTDAQAGDYWTAKRASA